MEKTPPRLWTSASCYNIIKTFACGVSQWVTVMQMKQAGESISEALERCIKAEPERFGYLYMILVVPTTDRRWAKKDLWLRQSRIFGKEKAVSESLRFAPRMPTPGTLRTPGSHGIQQDPEADSRKRLLDSISKAETAIANGEFDDGGDAGSSNDAPRPRRRARRANSATMLAKFKSIYDSHPELSESESTAPGGKQPMPTFNQTIWCKWSDWRRFPHYPATVMDINLIHDTVTDDARIMYVVRFDTDDNMNQLAGHMKMEQELFLDPDMNEWQYTDPSH